MAFFINCGPIAHESELRFLRTASNGLPPEWVVFGNPTIMKGKASPEFDAIILSPASLWGVEIKAWKGPIVADASNWRTPSEVRPSPLNIITAKMKRHLYEKVRLLENRVHAQSLVVLTNCTAANFKMTCPGSERVVFFDNVVNWFLEDEEKSARQLFHKLGSSRAKTALPENLLRKFIVALGGERAWQAYRSGGDVIPATMTAPGANLVLTLRQKKFARHYFSNDFSRLCLNKAELRGSEPDKWKYWRAEGAYVNFTDNGIEIEALPGIDVVVNGRQLGAGKSTPLDVKNGTIIIDEIQFTYSIENE